MLTLFTFDSPPQSCGYLPTRQSRMHYRVTGELTAAEYAGLMNEGWRRFGFALFRPNCPTCRECRSLRVDVAKFRPSATQKRVWKQNHGEVTLTVGEPSITAEKLALYDKFHAFQAGFKDWPDREPESPAAYAESFVDNPFPTEEWVYTVGDKLIGVGYVDRLSVGLSAMYFYYDPDERGRSPGVFNVLSVLDAARRDGLPHVYLGYFVGGCRSLEYKAKYRPNEVIDPETGEWAAFIA